MTLLLCISAIRTPLCDANTALVYPNSVARRHGEHLHLPSRHDPRERLFCTGTVTDAHGVDTNSVGATAHSHTDVDNRPQRLSQSVTASNGYPVTLL